MKVHIVFTAHAHTGRLNALVVTDRSPVQYWPVQYWPVQYWSVQYWSVQYWSVLVTVQVVGLVLNRWTHVIFYSSGSRGDP